MSNYFKRYEIRIYCMHDFVISKFGTSDNQFFPLNSKAIIKDLKWSDIFYLYNFLTMIIYNQTHSTM